MMKLKSLVFAGIAALVATGSAKADDRYDIFNFNKFFGGGNVGVVGSTSPIGRQMVSIDPKYAPGNIVIMTSERRLYYVTARGQAIRYGIGVGRDGFQWGGQHKISRKQEWPDWRPPPEMIERQPYLPRFMAGGPGNPMGARALYIGQTIYRIHGTNQPQTIGHAVSSGCFRLVNSDIIDLYERVPVGTRIVVKQAPKL